MMDAHHMVPEYSRVVTSNEDFVRCAENVGHFAIEMFEESFYHFIVTSWRDDWSNEQEYYIAFKNPYIRNKKLTEHAIKESISRGKVYVIDDPDYPKTDKEGQRANDGFWGDCNVFEGKCEEHLSYILTGRPFSRNIKSYGPWIYPTSKLSIYDDQNMKREILKSARCFLGSAMVPARDKPKLKENQGHTAAGYSTKELSIFDDPDMTREIFNTTGCFLESVMFPAHDNRGGTAPSKALCRRGHFQSSIDDDEERPSKEVEPISFTRTKTTLVKTGLRETFHAAEEIVDLRSRRTEGMLSKERFDREVAKSVSGAIGCTVGSACGEFIGEVLNPGKGFESGATFGGEIGQFLATSICDGFFK
uniref:Uncharacterized protein LOC111099577 isoform X1 n=1 Tax=Crassostrea virginica TaxID=6565 RepID=A0A8B8A549_CRAVI|nr:uncharacterized protein LOC111099577 isoform X1 [Crassostrea virginica]XP_022286903.1 uncharacterized protein LOC111099764 [Crassostrea virginica]